MDEIALVSSNSMKGDPTRTALYAHSILPVVSVRYPKKHRGHIKYIPSKMKKMGKCIDGCNSCCVISVDQQTAPFGCWRGFKMLLDSSSSRIDERSTCLFNSAEDLPATMGRKREGNSRERQPLLLLGCCG